MRRCDRSPCGGRAQPTARRRHRRGKDRMDCQRLRDRESVPRQVMRRRSSMFLDVLIGLAILLIVFVIVVATRPSEFRITRTANISAPLPTVFAQVNDFHNWEAWSPWAKLDPAMRQTYEGVPSGTGAVHTWSGNNKVGAGRATITESQPSHLIRIKLEFVRPFPSTNDVEFTFTPEANQTAVRWSM